MHNYHRLANIALKRLKTQKEGKIIAILGARQVGKTTLLNNFAATWQGKVLQYLGDKLEDANLWRGNFNEVKNNLEIRLGFPLEKINEPVLLIFDEIQKIPEAFDNLKILHDSYRSQIKIAISGSSALRLLHRTSESLGGRVEITTMYPLSFVEILNDQPHPLWLERSAADFDSIKSEVLKQAGRMDKAEKALAKTLSFGLFPEAYLQTSLDEVKLLHQNYHQTYIEKDVRDLKEVGNVLDFDAVWKIAHHSNSQLLSYANIARDSGLAYNTAKKYLSVLTASFSQFLLPPYIKNTRRRLVKSPKIFSIDIGFINYCLNLYGREELIRSQYIGGLFESLMILEFIKQERFFLIGGEPYFFRTSGGAEVDLVVEKGLDLYAYEFKYADKVHASDFKGIKSFSLAASNKVKAGFVVSRQPHAERHGDNLFAVPWWYFCL